MDIVLKKVSVDSLILIKLGIERMIHDLEFRLDEIKNDYDSASDYSKALYRVLLKDKKADLYELRNIYKQL